MDPESSTNDQPSTSQQNDSVPPIQKFGLKIGGKVLVLRVADKQDLLNNSYFCNKCPDVYFSTHQQLKKHIREHDKQEKIEKGLIICKHCDDAPIFVSNKALTNHLRSFHGDTLGFTCTKCGKQFTTRQYFNLHIRSHGDRLYCSKCVHWFKSTEELAKHNVHCKTAEQKRPYSCNFCPQTFKYPRDKVQHQRTHTGQKPFACEHCESRFSQMSALHVHTKIHTHEKMHKCRFCSNEYTDTSALRRHELRHHFKECQESALIE